MTVNLLGIYGAGPDEGPFGFGGWLKQLIDEMKAEFKDAIYVPRLIDYTEYATLKRLLAKWKDPTILVTHSCGSNAATHAAVELSMEPIPYMLCIAPSMFCPSAPLPPNVRRATQATSWLGDPFNLGGRQLIKASGVNNKTKIDTIFTGRGHVPAPGAPELRPRLRAEIKLALAGK